MPGLLEQLGLRPITVTAEMVEKRRQKAVEALKLLTPFVDRDEKTAAIRNGLAVRMANALKGPSLDLKYETLGEITAEAKAALKPAQVRKGEIDAREIAAGPGGLETLDTMVAALGGKAESEEAKNFVKGAIKARYNIDGLDGELTTKALPKLYEVLGKVPDWQVRDNPDLKNIQRVRSGPEGASLYAKEANETKGRPADLVYLELGRTGTFHMTSETYTSDSGQKLKLNEFSVTTLHEIGHAVDQTLDFMGRHGGDDKYGGWKEEKREDIAALIAAKKGFLTGWSKPYDTRQLTSLLDGVLETGKIDLTPWDNLGTSVDKTLGEKTDDEILAALVNDPGVLLAVGSRRDFDLAGTSTPQEQDNAYNTASPKVGPTWGLLRRDVQQMMISPILNDGVAAAVAAAVLLARWRGAQATLAKADRDRLEKHAAVEHCRAIRVTGENTGLWDKGGSAATKYAIDGRVYQQSYSTIWTSYSVGVRARGISQYQFRHAMEWFAELYAVYYLGKLPDTHADAVWLKADIDTDHRPG